MDRRKVLLGRVAGGTGRGRHWCSSTFGADDRVQQQFATVDVLKATAQIAAGESIADAESGGKLAVAKVARNQVLPGAQTDAASLTGEVALGLIYPGGQIISAKFGQPPRCSPRCRSRPG